MASISLRSRLHLFETLPLEGDNIEDEGYLEWKKQRHCDTDCPNCILNHFGIVCPKSEGYYPGENHKNNCDVRRSEDYDLQCQRCYDLTDILYKHYGAMDGSTDDWEGQPIPEGLREDIWLCWDCDWEVTNGYDMEVDIGELMMDREERAYEEDPINNTPPWLNYVQ